MRKMHADIPIASSSVLAAGRSLATEVSRVRRTPGARLHRQVLHCLLAFLVAYGSYFIFSNYFIQSVRVTGMSMHPTLRDAQHCFLNRWIFHLREPRRGEVVVLRDPADNGLAVKRVVACEGDSLTFARNGDILLNGARLTEPYLVKGTRTYPGPHFREQTLVCRKGEFIVLGDNRMNSADSRTYGPVPRANILGLLIP